MFCSNCGKEVPEGTKFCGFCGTPVASEKAEAVSTATEAAAEAASTATEAVAEAASTATATASEAVSTAQATAAEAANVAQASVWENPQGGQEPEKPKKKGKGGVIAGILVAVAALAAVIGGLFLFAGKSFENTIHKTFDKPKDYYTYVEKKNITALKEKATTGQVQKVFEQLKNTEGGATETVTLKLGPRGKEYAALATTAGVDLSWLESAGMQYSVIMQDNKISAELIPILNNVNILKAEILMDVQAGKLYAGLPELASQYFCISAGDDYDFEEIREQMGKIFEIYGKMLDSYPDADTMEKLVNKYYDLVMENIEEVVKSKATIEAGDVSEECTLLTIELKGKDIAKIAKAVMEELKDDEDVKEMMFSFYEAFKEVDENINGEDMYKEFQEDLDKALKELDEEEIDIDKLVLENYVDKQGAIVARTITVKHDDETMEVKVAWLSKDDKRGFELSAKGGDDDLTIVGNGTEKGGKFNGEFVLSVDKKKYVNFGIEDYDVEAAKDGKLSGIFTIKPGKDADLESLIAEAAEEVDNSALSALLSTLKPSLKIKMDVEENKHDVDLCILDDGTELITISVSGNEISDPEIVIPTDVINLEIDETPSKKVLSDYVKTLDVDKVINALKEANLPKEWTDVLDQYKAFLPQIVENIR